MEAVRIAESLAAVAAGHPTEAGKVLEHKEAFNWGYQDNLDPFGGDGIYVELDGSKNMYNVYPNESGIPGFFSGIQQVYGRVREACQ